MTSQFVIRPVRMLVLSVVVFHPGSFAGAAAQPAAEEASPLDDPEPAKPLTRPSGSITSLTLDEAWSAYNRDVGEAQEMLLAELDVALKEAASEGALDRCERLLAQQRAVKELDFSELKTHEDESYGKFFLLIQAAAQPLRRAYDAVSVRLDNDRRLASAAKVRDEADQLFPRPAVAEDGKQWVLLSGALELPQQSPQIPELKAAWEQYRQRLAEISTEVFVGLEDERNDVEATVRLLPLGEREIAVARVEAIVAAVDLMREHGTLPQGEAWSAMRAAAGQAHADAKLCLNRDYTEVVKMLTRQERFEVAREVENERVALRLLEDASVQIAPTSIVGTWRSGDGWIKEFSDDGAARSIGPQGKTDQAGKWRQSGPEQFTADLSGGWRWEIQINQANPEEADLKGFQRNRLIRQLPLTKER